MAAPGKGLIFGGMATGAGLVLTALGLAPATQEALPFGLGLFVFGLFFLIPGIRALRRRLAVEAVEEGGAHRAADEGPPSHVECPNCRGPAPLCLFEPKQSTCAYCQHQFALPRELAQRLAAGAALVKAQSDAERHIARSIEALAAHQASWLSTLRRLTWGLLAVALAVGAWAFAVRLTNDNWHAFFALALASGALAATLGAQLRSRVPRAVERIVGRWTALKLPNVEGLCCRVCGGPLPGEAKPVLRCGYCSADNLAGEGVLARVAAGAAHAAAGALKVGQRRQQGEELFAFALNAYVPATLVGWFALGAMAGSAFLALDEHMRLWIDDSNRWALVRLNEGGAVRPCLAAMKETPEGVQLWVDAPRKLTVSREKLAAVTAGEPVAPSSLVGKRIAGEGKVERIVRYLRWPDRHMARIEGDAWDHYLPSNFGGGSLSCFEEEVSGEALELPPAKY